MLIIHQDTIWHCQRETEVESDGGICRIPDKERDMTARPVWGQTNLSLVPACLMSHSLATRWGDPHNINILMPPPSPFSSLHFLCCPPFHLLSRVPPYSPALTQIRSGARREVKERIHSTYQTKAWHRYKRGDQHFKSIWCRWTVQQGQLQQGSTKLPQTCGNGWGAALLFLHLYASLINCVYKIGRSLSLGYSPCVAWQLLQGKQFFLLQ